jgi:2-methylisocitrate lyase-like PEP mutase family enzyme
VSAATVDELAERARVLRSLHVPGRPLVLANAWDAASARAVAAIGLPAVASASSAVAAVLGYEDGEEMPIEAALAAVARIAAAVDVPVTADIEAGYGLEGAELAARLIDAGVVGCNLEDTDHERGGLVEIDRQAARIADLRAAANRLGVPLVINARVDVHLQEVGPAEGRLDASIARGRAYRDAGADCIYPIFVADEPTIERLVEAFDGLINVYARPEAPSLARLAALGVARISYGPWIHRLAMREADRILAAIARGSDPYPSAGRGSGAT